MAGGPGPAIAAQAQRFEATVSRVRVDVIARDGDGNFVDDLRALDFRVFEDGDEQEILGVQLVDLSAGVLVDRTEAEPSDEPIIDLSRLTNLAANLDPAEGNPNERSSDFGAMVFVVDFQGLDFRNKLRFTQAWEDLIAQTESLQVPRAVYLIDQVGRLHELAPLTQDPEILRAAAREVSDSSNVRRSLRDERIEDTGPGDEMMRRYRDRDTAIYTYDLLTQFADGLAARSGRTALVWVSTGVNLNYGAAFSTGGLADGGRPTFEGSPNPMVLQRQKAFHRAANSANVSVYTVDPTPKVEMVGGMADGRFGPIGDDGVTPLAGSLQLGIELDARRNSLRLAANDTGGRSFIGWADLKEVLVDIEQDTGRYYLLTYAAPLPEGDGDYHDIRVEVEREGIDVRAREGYFDYDAADRRSRFVSAALSLPGTVADLPLEAEATRLWRADGTPLVMLTAAVPADEIGLSVDAEGTLAKLEVHAALLDEWLELKSDHHGALVRRLRPAADRGAAPSAAATAPSLPPGELLVYRYEWPVEAGEFDLRIMVLDETTGRVGSARMELVVPDLDLAAGDWQSSDLVLVQTDGANYSQPVVGGRIPAGRVVSAFLEVYGGETPVLSGFIQATASAISALRGGVELIPTPMYAEDDGVHRGALVLPPLSPGRYRLEVSVEDGAAANGRSFVSELEVMTVAGRPSRE